MARPGGKLTTRLVTLASAGLASGLALLTALVVYVGTGELARTLASAGAGLLWVSLFHVVPITASALGWYAVIAPVERPCLRTMIWARWIAESINQLLPALHVGGNVVRAQRLARAGVPGGLAAASVVVDITLHLFAQLIFTALGLSILLKHANGLGVDGGVVAGFVLSTAGAAAFYVAQRHGLFTAAAGSFRRVFRYPEWSSVSQGAGAIDAWIAGLYEYQWSLAHAEFWHVVSWLLGTGETWLALRFLGHPVDLTTALVIESFGEAVRTAAFPIPGALGVQEGSFVMLGEFFGLAPGVSLALSLAKRVRELGLGIPGLIVWQVERAVAARAERRAACGEVAG